MTPRLTVGFVVLLLTACSQASPFGASAPSDQPGDFSLVAYQGSDLLGGTHSHFLKVFDQRKPVVLNFWAGLCPPCRAEMPGFQAVSQELSGRILFVGVDVGPYLELGTHQDAIRLYRQLGIHYPLAYATDSSPLQRYSVVGMPTTVFFTARGKLVYEATGIVTEDQLRSIIEQKLFTNG